MRASELLELWETFIALWEKHRFDSGVPLLAILTELRSEVAPEERARLAPQTREWVHGQMTIVIEGLRDAGRETSSVSRGVEVYVSDRPDTKWAEDVDKEAEADSAPEATRHETSPLPGRPGEGGTPNRNLTHGKKGTKGGPPQRRS